MKVRIIDPCVYKKWDKLVERHPWGTIFHTSHWCKVLTASYKYRPFFVVLEDSTGDVKAGIPLYYISDFLRGKRLVSVPFADYADPLIHDEAEFLLMFDFIKKNVEVNHIEIKSYHSSPLLQKIRGENGMFGMAEEYVIHQIKLRKTLEDMYASFDRRVRQRLRKLSDLPIIAVRDNSFKGLRELYKLNLQVRKKYGVPLQPWKFFLNVWRILVKNGMGFMLFAKFLPENRKINGILFLTYNKKIHAKYNGSITEYLKYLPNYLIHYKAIEWGVSNSYKIFDMGRSFVHEKGLIQFKKKWAANNSKLTYFYYPNTRNITNSYNQGIWGIGNLLINKGPSFICRVTGEMFYKTFG